jgi:LacI family transcriptional regulator
VRPTIKDIAAAVGVSTNTVSRALSGKGRVAPETRRRVLEAAKEMHYLRNQSARALARRQLKVAAVYPVDPREFYSHIARGIAEQAEAMADYRCSVSLHPYPSIETPVSLRQVLVSLLEDKPDGLILTCSHRFEEYRDVLEVFAAAGVPVVYATIFGDMLPGVVGGVRTNTHTAGRIAAEFLGLVTPGAADGPRKVAIMVGAKNQLVYQECVDGFTAQAPVAGVDPVAVLETHGRADLAYEATARLLATTARTGSELSGIYVASHNSVGVCQYLEDHSLTGRVRVIGHDLYPELCQKMRQGSLTATLFQGQFDQARSAVQLMVSHLDSEVAATAPKIRLVEPTLVLPSMIDSFVDYI